MVAWSQPIRLSAVLVVLPLAVAMAGCAAATPTCDEASGLVAASRLGDAAATYALARERGEGDCAQSGLTAVKNSYGDAYVEVAKGRVAEEGRDIDRAVTAYRAALAIDAGNPTAKEALARLQQPEPTLQPLPPPPPVATSPSAVPPSVIWLAGAALVLLLVVAGLLAWTVVRWRGWTADRKGEHDGLRQRLEGVEDGARRALREELVEYDKRAAGNTDRINGRLHTQERTLHEMRSSLRELREELGRVPVNVSKAASLRLDALEQHLDHVVDAFVEIVANGGQPTFERFVPQTRTVDADEQH
jgi:hypothetical protein